jgi:hypothetical protein
LANNTFDDSFFNDALDTDFFTPYNIAPSPAIVKKSLIAQIDAEKEGDDDIKAEKDLALNCNKMWYEPMGHNVPRHREMVLTTLTGKNFKTVPKCRPVSSTSTAYAPSYRRRPSARGQARWSPRRISTKLLRSIWARTAYAWTLRLLRTLRLP